MEMLFSNVFVQFRGVVSGKKKKSKATQDPYARHVKAIKKIATINMDSRIYLESQS